MAVERADGRAKRQAGTGQIIERVPGKLYLVRLFLGRDEAGKKKYDNHRVYGTRRDAEAKLRALLTARDDHTYVRQTNEAVAQYLKRWLASKQWKSLRTREDYTEVCERYIIPALGTYKLSELRAAHIAKMLADLQSRGIVRQREYAFQVLRAALNQAVRAGELPSSPMRGVEAPSKDAVSPLGADGEPENDDEDDGDAAARALTDDEAGRFLTEAEKSPYAALFALALDSGMRPGEYRALRWRDLSDDCATVSVRRAVEELNDGIRIKTRLKTKLSRRNIKLAPATAELLRAHRDRQRFALQPEPGKLDDQLVFPNENGRVMDEANLVRRHYKPLLRAAGIDDSHRLYDLRHTMATTLLHADVNVVTVSRRLGHAKVSMTLDRYASCFTEHQDAAVEKLQAIYYDARRATA